MKRLPTVFVVSDSIGETGEVVLRAAATQFDSGILDVRRIHNLNSKQEIEDVVKDASSIGAIIVYTLVVFSLAQHLKACAEEAGVITVDVLAPMMKALERSSGLEPRGEPGLLRKMDDSYFRRVEAVEFAVRYDDGKDPRGVLQADIVLVGVSRTSKTPLSMYLAHRGIKVANIPLVPEIKPPEELFRIERERVVGLVIHPEPLNQIRTERLRTLGLKGQASYADQERIVTELEYAREIMKRIGCPIIDVTNRAIEETASKILEIFYRRLSNGQ
ncbi:MAG: pyruvate, water dikinase regulatory protein [Syntrophomonadaceae bacterium]|nr:pyruvate, water dikinase regulatory protein [Syntrophomonadaceae bacterium]